MSDRELAAGEWGGVTVLGRAAKLPLRRWPGRVCPHVPCAQPGRSRTTQQSLPGASLQGEEGESFLRQIGRLVGPSGGALWPLQRLSMGNAGKGCVIPTWIPGWPPWQAMWKQQVPGFQGQRELRGHELQPPHPAFSLHQTQPPGYRLCLNTPSNGKLIPVSAARSHP